MTPEERGRVLTDQALVASDEAAAHLRPAGCDPSRAAELCHLLKASWWIGLRPEDGKYSARVVFSTYEQAKAAYTLLVQLRDGPVIEAREGQDAKRLDAKHESTVGAAEALSPHPPHDKGDRLEIGR